jgi:quinolinate synthase
MDRMAPTDLAEEIQRWKEERDALILAHYFQMGEVQAVADHVGEKKDLLRIGARSSARVLVLCGVQFMAEMAAILSPEKTVLLPDPNAGCPMVEMVSTSDLRELKARHPGAKVVAYLKSKAEMKAESDLCCDSPEAPSVLRGVEGTEVILSPDRNLGQYLAGKTEKRLHLMKAFCPPRMRILLRSVQERREEHPGAELLIHPQCRPDVIALADRVLSDGEMAAYVRTSPSQEFIIGSEVGLVETLQRLAPEKRFYPASTQALCQNMKLTTQEKVLWSLEEMEHRVEVPEAVAEKVRPLLQEMLERGE